MTSLYDNYVGPPGSTNLYPNTSAQIGPPFTVTADAYCTGLRYHRTSSGSTYTPGYIRLYDVTAGSELANIPIDTVDTAPGWHDYPLPTGKTLPNGHTFVVAVTLPSTQNFSYVASSQVGTPPSPLAFLSNHRAYRLDTNENPSFTTDNNYAPLVDILLDGTTSGTGGASVTDVDNALASWVSTNANDHEGTSAPFQTWQATGRIEDGVNANNGILTRLNNLSDDAMAWLNDRSNAAVDLLNGASQAAIDFLNDGGAQVAGLVDKLARDPVDGAIATGNALTDLYNRLRTHFDARFDTVPQEGSTTWELVDSGTWTENGSAGVQAHSYLVEVVDHPASDPGISTPAGLWLPRAGWAVTVRDGWASQRQYMDYAKRVIDDNGRLMDDAYWRFGPGFAGTWQAWRLV